jgi:hypothetical protein
MLCNCSSVSARLSFFLSGTPTHQTSLWQWHYTVYGSSSSMINMLLYSIATEATLFCTSFPRHLLMALKWVMRVHFEWGFRAVAWNNLPEVVCSISCSLVNLYLFVYSQKQRSNEKYKVLLLSPVRELDHSPPLFSYTLGISGMWQERKNFFFILLPMLDKYTLDQVSIRYG